MTMTLLIFLLAGAAQWSGAAAGRSEKLARALRRQLMQDNYDYIQDSHSDQLPQHPPPPPSRRAYADDEYIDNGGDEYHFDHSYTYDSRHQHDVHEDDTDRELQYYVEAQRFSDGEPRAAPRDLPYTTPRYTLLEAPVKSGRRNRKSRRRFLQEELPGGVAIMKLDNGPFPEFRLPRDRRQYMGGFEADEMDEDEERPPADQPPVYGPDPPGDAAGPRYSPRRRADVAIDDLMYLTQ